MGIRGALNVVQLIWQLLRDKRVSWLAKAVFILPVAYLISPVDLVPDISLPGLGQVDDVVVFMLICRLFLALCPKDVVLEHKTRIADRTKRLGLR